MPMRIIIFGTVIRTRKSLEKILIEAVRQERHTCDAFKDTFIELVGVYNSGLFGLVFYRITSRHKNKKYFIEKANAAS